MVKRAIRTKNRSSCRTLFPILSFRPKKLHRFQLHVKWIPTSRRRGTRKAAGFRQHCVVGRYDQHSATIDRTVALHVCERYLNRQSIKHLIGLVWSFASAVLPFVPSGHYRRGALCQSGVPQSRVWTFLVEDNKPCDQQLLAAGWFSRVCEQPTGQGALTSHAYMQTNI